MSISTGNVTTASLNLRKSPGGDLADAHDYFVLGTPVEIYLDSGDGWLLAHGRDSNGVMAWGYVDANFVAIDPTGPTPPQLDLSVQKVLWVVGYHRLGDFLDRATRVGATAVAIRTDRANYFEHAIPEFH